MNNKKTYVFLYYFAFLLSILVCSIPSILRITFVSDIEAYNGYFYLSTFSYCLTFINIVLVIIFSILLIKKKLNSVNILFPILYILFAIIVLVVCILFNKRLVVPYIQYSYYINFILINYFLLNLYSILSVDKIFKKSTK